MARLSSLLALCFLAACFLNVEAGCYRNGYKPRQVSEADKFHNFTPVEVLEPEQLPQHFNWCNYDGQNFCTASWNQHIPVYCGACWVHGTLSAVQDRLKIRKLAAGLKGMDVMLGRQTLLNCAAFEGFGGGCDGGDPIDVYHYMAKFGLPDESCWHYNATDHTKWKGDKHCPADAYCRNCMPINNTDTCWAVKTPVVYKLSSFGVIRTKSLDQQPRAMMSEIYKRGPITCSIATPDEFTYGYRRGIYQYGANVTAADIDHNVEVVGWGEEDGVKYWIIRNSWGTFWGELSFFRLERGTNQLLIEAGDCWLAEPTFEMEQLVDEGGAGGSMFGIVLPKAAAQA